MNVSAVHVHAMCMLRACTCPTVICAAAGPKRETSVVFDPSFAMPLSISGAATSSSLKTPASTSCITASAVMGLVPLPKRNVSDVETGLPSACMPAATLNSPSAVLNESCIEKPVVRDNRSKCICIVRRSRESLLSSAPGQPRSGTIST
eukprot:6209618-Pleurochrysis_carterae.AAC.2